MKISSYVHRVRLPFQNVLRSWTCGLVGRVELLIPLSQASYGFVFLHQLRVFQIFLLIKQQNVPFYLEEIRIAVKSINKSKFYVNENISKFVMINYFHSIYVMAYFLYCLWINKINIKDLIFINGNIQALEQYLHKIKK